MDTTDRPEAHGPRKTESLTDPFASAVFRVGVRPPPPAPATGTVSLPRRLLGGALAGLVGGLGLYVVLAMVATDQGRAMAYPFQAVLALLSGKRVLPDHPQPSLADGQVQDALTGPIYFFLPAIAIGVLTAYRLRGHQTAAGWGSWARNAALPAALAATLMLVVFVIGIAGHEADQTTQRFSSGYGIRQLGYLGWLIGHITFVALLAATLRTLTLSTARRRRVRQPPQ